MRLRAALGVAAGVLLVLCAPGSLFAQASKASPEEFPVFRALIGIASDPREQPASRLTAIRGLGEAAHPAVVPILLTLLADPDPTIREAAVSALGWAGNSAAVRPVLARATDVAEIAEVRIAAIAALGRIGELDVVPSIEGLTVASDARIRREALLTLMESLLSKGADKGAAAIRLLGDLAEDGYTRSRAATLLGAWKDSRAMEPLSEAFRDTRPPAGYSNLPLPDKLSGQMRTLAARLRSLHNVRAHAARALGQLGDPRAGPLLLNGLSDSDPLVRIESAQALGSLRPSGSAAALMQALQDPDPYVREAVAVGLGMLGEPSVAPVLLGALQDQEAGVRRQAALALGRLGATAARAALVKLAEEDPSPAVRQAAHAALGRLGRLLEPSR